MVKQMQQQPAPPLQLQQVPLDPMVKLQPVPPQLRQVPLDPMVKLQPVPLQLRQVPLDPMVRRQAPLLSQVRLHLMVNQALLCYANYVHFETV